MLVLLQRTRINIGTNANTGGRAITIGNSVTGTVLNLTAPTILLLGLFNVGNTASDANAINIGTKFFIRWQKQLLLEILLQGSVLNLTSPTITFFINYFKFRCNYKYYKYSRYS